MYTVYGIVQFHASVHAFNTDEVQTGAAGRKSYKNSHNYQQYQTFV